jgi:hypothetical protein
MVFAEIAAWILRDDTIIGFPRVPGKLLLA